MKKLALIALALTLTGCADLNTYVDTRTDFPTKAVKQEVFYFQKDMEYECYKRSGWFTKDNASCFVEGKLYCYWLVKTGVERNTQELIAMCNGWRPYPIIRLW